MASELRVVISGRDAGATLSADAMFTDVVGLLERYEQCWSRFLPDSDISRLNGAQGRPVEVDPSTITLVSAMVEGWQLTDGRFDPSILPALIDCGYVSSIDDVHLVTILPSGDFVIGGFDDPTTADNGIAGSTMADIGIDATSNTITLPVGLAIDPGGIGKGLAADLAVEHLLALGAPGALVSIGGDMMMRGTPPPDFGDSWTVAIQHPLHADSTVGTLVVDAGGVATSSTQSRRWVHDGEQRHHVIDPDRSWPSTTDLASVTVVARSGWLAEVHATAALLAGSHRTIGYLDANELSGVAVTTAGDVFATPDLDLLTDELVPEGSRR
jgi:thiamine biosynthesis lipoprotein